MKKFMLICAPVSSRSGYGDHARDLVRSFIKHDKYEIQILDVPWGDCPRNALDMEKDFEIFTRILKTNKVDRQPDVYVDIRIPNEFQQYGKVNIGITAGIETTTVSLFEGTDENIYKPIDDSSLDLVDDIKEDFAFLHVGQWTKGGYGEDRKDIAKLIKIFYESFANKKEKPALILKSNGATYSILDREDCLRKINEIKDKFPKDWNLPNVYLLHGSLSEEDMNKLYNHPKVKSFVSLTHGEGFGRPLLEATMTGLPVITSAWSGHLDFLSQEDCLLLGGELKQVPNSMVWKDIIVPESQWFNVNEQQAYKAMNYCFKEYNEVKEKALNLMKTNRDKFTLDKMIEKLDKIVTPLIDKVPSQVGLQLPKLKKVGDKSNESPKIKLPKLKKLKEEASV